MSNIYFETLGETVRAFVTQIFDRKGTLAANTQEEICASIGPVSYGQTISRSFPLSDYKGKATKKFAHLSVYRMESGRYELTNYIL